VDGLRKPFQGVSNILRFNWHFYMFAFGATAAIAVAGVGVEDILRYVCIGTAVAIGSSMLVSLLVSFYVYDASGLYRLDWLAAANLGPDGKMLSIHAGFDETTSLLRARYPRALWTVMDFYDPAKHTEISIKRARRSYPPSPDDVRVSTSKLPLSSASVDAIFVLLAAHEIRDEQERFTFFAELHRVLKMGGRIVVLEHLRDRPNALAYTLGVFHFIGERSWLALFDRAGLRIAQRLKPNRFMTCFVLEKHVATS